MRCLFEDGLLISMRCIFDMYIFDINIPHPPPPLPHVSPVSSSINSPSLPKMGIDKPSISSSKGIDAYSFAGRPR